MIAASAPLYLLEAASPMHTPAMTYCQVLPCRNMWREARAEARMKKVANVSGVIQRLFLTFVGDKAMNNAASRPTQVLFVSCLPIKKVSSTEPTPKHTVTIRPNRTAVGIGARVTPIVNCTGAKMS